MVSEFTVSLASEGKAVFLIPNVPNNLKNVRHIETKLPVFYNPKMKFNRDISITILETFLEENYGNGFIVDAISGTGIRSISYLLEMDYDFQIVANDINPLSTYFIKQNAILNGVSSSVDITNMDANSLLTNVSNEQIFPTNIDLDPFGSPVPFYASALRAISKPGLLSITATDTAVLCGVYPNVAFRKYGGIPINNEFCHEIGIRLLIYSVARIAMQFDYIIIPLVSLSTEHYLRIWVKVIKGRNIANASLNNFGYIYYCSKCFSREIVSISKGGERLCPFCSSKMQIAGPLWIGPIFNHEFIVRSIKFSNTKRVLKTLQKMRDESLMPPTYYNLHLIAKLVNKSVRSPDFIIKKLKELGYNATRTHFNPNSIRTSASIKTIKSLM